MQPGHRPSRQILLHHPRRAERTNGVLPSLLLSPGVDRVAYEAASERWRSVTTDTNRADPEDKALTDFNGLAMTWLVRDLGRAFHIASVELEPFELVPTNTFERSKTNMTQLSALFAFKYDLGAVAPSPHCDLGAGVQPLRTQATPHTQHRLSGSLKNEALAESMRVSLAKLSRCCERRTSGHLVKRTRCMRFPAAHLVRNLQISLFVAFAINAMCKIVQFRCCSMEHCSSVKA